MNRRSFMEMAVAMGATACWANPFAKQSKPNWQERRDLFPEGVASGDPDSHSVVLWTRYPETRQRSEVKLNVEVAEDERFAHVIASAKAPVSAASDWTCRVLVGGLKPSQVYWYGFSISCSPASTWPGCRPGLAKAVSSCLRHVSR
jgi:alkaline phosphatase D